MSRAAVADWPRAPIGALVAVVVACACAMSVHAGQLHADELPVASRPNIVLIVADDLGVTDLSFLGASDLYTPNLDRLASEGVFLSDAHVSASVCAPSRAGLITGRYQQRFGAECNGTGPGGINVPGEVVTIPEALKEQHYQTVAIGKWHLGDAPECHPNFQGFDSFSGFLGGGRSYWPIDQPRPAQRLERNGAAVPESEIGYLTDWLTEEALGYLRDRDPDRAVFMYIAYNAPHTPMHALEEDLARFPELTGNRKIYAAMVLAMDRGIGRILDELEAQGIANDTLVVFLSDNGGATTNASDNGPWRGMKGSLWEGGQRVPMIVRWNAGRVSGGQSLPILASSLDLFPTFLSAAGVGGGPDFESLDGIDLLPLLSKTQAQPDRDTLYWRRAAAAGVREGDWKLWRIRELDGGYRYGLVNLKQDPAELVDRSQDQPNVLGRLAEQLEAWELSLKAPRWLEGEYWEQNQRSKHDFEVHGRDAERRLP